MNVYILSFRLQFILLKYLFKLFEVYIYFHSERRPSKYQPLVNEVALLDCNFLECIRLQNENIAFLL